MKNKNTKQNQHSHPGRPKYTPVYPRTKEWTFTDWMEANGIDINPNSKSFGKGPNCTMLTLRKAMERDMFFHKQGKRIVAANRTKANPRSTMLVVRGVTAEPNSESGLGRRATLYCLRAKGASVKHATVAPKASAKPAVKAKASAKISTKSQTPVSDALDKIHAALATPDPVPATPTLTVPAVTIAPEATPAPVIPVAPAPEPVAETPAPVIPEAAPAPVVTETATLAPVSTLANS
jgi:hypothetical protein